MLWLYEGLMLDITMCPFADEEVWLVGCLKFEPRVARLRSLKAFAVWEKSRSLRASVIGERGRGGGGWMRAITNLLIIHWNLRYN
jgi:hypothetical protein